MNPSVPPTPAGRSAVPPAASPSPGSPGVPGTASRLKMVLGAIAFVALGLSVWLYALLFYEQGRKVDELADRTFPEAAQPICAAAVAMVDGLPAAPDSPDNTARAAVVDQGTDRLETMVADLRRVVPATEDAPGINTWLDHWELWLRDRREYADRLRTDPEARFYVSEVDGTHVTKGVDHFAEVNRMESCATTGDVG